MLDFLLILTYSSNTHLDFLPISSCGQIVIPDNFFYWNQFYYFPLPSISPHIDSHYYYSTSENKEQLADTLLKPVIYILIVYLGTIFIPNFSSYFSKEFTQGDSEAYDGEKILQAENKQSHNKFNGFNSFFLTEFSIFPKKAEMEPKVILCDTWDSYTDSKFYQENFTFEPLISDQRKDPNSFNNDPIPINSFGPENRFQIFMEHSTLFAENNWY